MNFKKYLNEEKIDVDAIYCDLLSYVDGIIYVHKSGNKYKTAFSSNFAEKDKQNFENYWKFREREFKSLDKMYDFIINKCKFAGRHIEISSTKIFK